LKVLYPSILDPSYPSPSNGAAELEAVPEVKLELELELEAGWREEE